MRKIAAKLVALPILLLLTALVFGAIGCGDGAAETTTTSQAVTTTAAPETTTTAPPETTTTAAPETTTTAAAELEGVVTLYLAGSLSVPFEQLEALFEKDHPKADVLLESGGSAAMISKIITESDAGENPPDIMASADYLLIPDRMYEGGYADWTIVFARNTMVLCYADGAPFADAIVNGTRAWYDVLRNEDVKWGHSDPDADPCGYRSMMVFQLAQKYYYEEAQTFGLSPDENAKGLYGACIAGTDQERGRKNQGNEVVRTKSVDLVALLEAGELDYAFEYRSVAVQHGLNYIELDDAVNLAGVGVIGDSGMTYTDFYGKATVQLKTESGEYKPTVGAAVVYGITIPAGSPNAAAAVEFIKLLLSEEGKQVMEVDNGQPLLDPIRCDKPDALPSELKGLVEAL
ncbi:MAG: tungstate ABC transporter substrate-binding protein WtpA [Thermoleophilia bacterium]|nr:tungstate ABC transporter substrate-binding protein WtpA [Thermoleophilia bacterium]